MKKLTGVLIVMLISLQHRSLAQDKHVTDSLESQLKQLQAEKAELHNNVPNIRDSSIVKVLHGLCWSYINNNPDKAIDYSKQMLALSEQIRWKKGIGTAYTSIGAICRVQGNYPEALKNHFAALKIYEETNDKRGTAVAHNSIGQIYENQNNYPEAIKNLFAALKIYRETGDKKRLAGIYNNIGNVYQDQSNYPQAMKNYFAALKINGETGNKGWLANNYGNIANVYSAQGNSPEALKNYFAALKTFEEIGDKEGTAIAYCNIGIEYTKLNRVKEGKTWLQKGLALYKEIGAKKGIEESYKELAFADSALGNFKSAFENHKMYIQYKDSLLNDENTKKQTQTEMQYEFDKKETLTKAEQEKKDAVAEQELQMQKLVRNGFIAGFVVVLLFAFVFFRQRNKIEKEKMRSDELRHLVEEKHKEITDSINYAERIQRSFLASKELLDENLEDYFVFFKPKDIVSGDFYWASKIASSDGIENSNFALVTADSTGHGVPGAIMSLLNITSIEKAIENHTQPIDILNATRITIIDRLKKDGSPEGGKDGMDCSLLVFDFENKKLTIAAANNPVWIARTPLSPREGTRGEVQTIEIKPDKMPVGKHDKQDVSFTQKEIHFQSGDVIYTLTDGFSDQFGGPNGKKFMSKNLRELLAANTHLSMKEQKQLLETTFTNWLGDFEQVDDVTLIGVRV